MLNIIEDTRNEFKVKLTDKFEREVIAFLNTDGGDIYIGVNDKGEIVGLNGNIDQLQRTIKDRIQNNIGPSTLGLYTVNLMEENGKKYIKVSISRGDEDPYYIRTMGMTPESCFVRVGSSTQSMRYDIINNRANKKYRNSLQILTSPRQDLTFNQLKIYYEEKGFKINDNFLRQLDLYTEENKFNFVAYLLSDNNRIPIKFAKYSGTDVMDLIENEDYGYCSIIKATQNVLSKLKIENRIYTKITYPNRKEIEMFDYIAVREAVINAIVHNDWSDGFSPKFEMFSDRLVITSIGGMQRNVTEDEFLKGVSLPKNKELMKIFNDLELVEQMGTSVLRILKSYDKKSFCFYPNFIIVTFPFRKNTFEDEDKENIDNEIQEELGISFTQSMIIKIIKETPRVTREKIAQALDVSCSTVQRNIRALIDLGILKRDGAKKNGEWIIEYKEYYKNLTE